MNKLMSVIIVTWNREKDIEKCLDSVLASDYSNLEIIVVDNASIDGTVELLEKKYQNKIKLIKSSTNLMAGGGRNLGATVAQGEFLLFIDSDNVIDAKMISILHKNISEIPEAGMVGPKMYYLSAPKIIWWAGAEINLLTSKTTYRGLDEEDVGQYDKNFQVGHIPNVFMVKKEIWDKVGGIDLQFVMHYEESDLAEKIKKIGKKIYFIPEAKTWHNIPRGSDKSSRNFGGETAERVYYTARNRVLFMKRNAGLLNYFLFVFLFNPVFVLLYCYKYLKNGQIFAIKRYLKGTFDGLFCKKD
ncbi:MAG: glycosyltransferase family 2 protein [Patescibacteria group bacterium]